MDDIKSARDIAMEKVAQLGEITEEERLTWKYIPQGEKLATGYLKQDCNLAAELAKYDDQAARYVTRGASDVLVRNIELPRDDASRRRNKLVMDGIKVLKKDKVALENTYSQMRNVFNHYLEQGEQQRQAAYASLKSEFEGRMRQAMQQQMGMMAPVKMDVERQPQFQEEWRLRRTQIDMQYRKLLDEYKQELREIE